MRKVWPDSFVEEANLTVNISALRRNLGETPSGEQYIETVPQKGSRFAVPVSQLPVNNHAAPLTIAPPADPPQMASVPREDALAWNLSLSGSVREDRIWFRSAILTLGLIAIVVLAALGYQAFRNRSDPRQLAQLPRRLAVLPFQNLQENLNTDFLGFSLADAIITKPGYVSEITVRPSYAVQKYRSQAIDIPKAAKDLNVDTLLIGTFLREGDDLRIACQLINVKTENLSLEGSSRS
jgi:TolB-like protein